MLVPWFKSNGWIQNEEGIAEIMARVPFCKGCLGDRTVQWSGNCDIRRCCTEEKGLAHCGECADFPCARLNEWAASGGHHTAALENLKRIRDRIE